MNENTQKDTTYSVMHPDGTCLTEMTLDELKDNGMIPKLMKETIDYDFYQTLKQHENT